MSNTDVLGDVLRQVYTFYGLPSEGPPVGLNVSGIFPESDTDKGEIDLLRRLCNNHEALRAFSRCRTLIDEIESQSDDKIFLEDLSDVISSTKIDFDYFLQGIIWFTQASIIDPRRPDSPKDLLKINVDVPSEWKFLQQVQGSLVFRLYVALVYMRGGPLDKILSLGNKSKRQSISRYYKLLKSDDYVRHLRNALAHGSFHPTIAGLYFKDINFEAIGTPKFLDKLCAWIFAIHFQCFAVCAKQNGYTS